MTQSRKRTKKLKPSESFKIDWAMAGIAMGLGSFSQHKIKENEGFIVGTDISSGVLLKGIRCYYYNENGVRRLSIKTHKKICDYLVTILEHLPEFQKEREVTMEPFSEPV